MDIYDFTGLYGQDWNQGVLIDNLNRAEAAGMKVHTMAIRQYVTGPDGGASFPVVCGDIIAVWTEDGRMDGRCGLPIVPGRGACEGHADQQEAWRGQCEAEVIAWEREVDSWA